jgi:Phage integrase family.
VKDTKSESGLRALKIRDDVIKELHYAKEKLKIESEYICANLDGSPITIPSILSMLRRAREKYKLEYITSYGLRHTFGNIQKHNGSDSYTVSKLMGHSSPRITEEHYYSEDEEMNDAAMDKIFDSLLKTANEKPNNNELPAKSD